MSHLDKSMARTPDLVSPLVLSDRLIALAQAADGAGYTHAAEMLVTLAYSVLDEVPITQH
jgi:hypothetical protein